MLRCAFRAEQFDQDLFCPSTPYLMLAFNMVKLFVCLRHARSLWKYLRSFSIRLNGPAAPGLHRPSVPGCSLLPHREPTPACANSAARFASPALWQSSKPTDDRGLRPNALKLVRPAARANFPEAKTDAHALAMSLIVKAANKGDFATWREIREIVEGKTRYR